MATAPRAGARRKAVRSRSRIAGLCRMPAIPTLIGAVALATAAGGVIGIGSGQPPDARPIQFSASSAQSLNGTDAFFTNADRDPRALAISRDSEREALKDATAANLRRAAEAQSQQRSVQLASLAKSAERRANEIAKNLWVLPTIGYHLTARFGQSSGLWSHNHTGLDFAAPSGTPIFAVANGVITSAGYEGSYGNKTVETLEDGTEIWYCHQSEIGVTVGERVTQSDQIGRIGSTGNVTGPHVHIEVRPGGGDPIDPYPAFLYHGVQP